MPSEKFEEEKIKRRSWRSWPHTIFRMYSSTWLIWVEVFSGNLLSFSLEFNPSNFVTNIPPNPDAPMINKKVDFILLPYVGRDVWFSEFYAVQVYKKKESIISKVELAPMLHSPEPLSTSCLRLIRGESLFSIWAPRSFRGESEAFLDPLPVISVTFICKRGCPAIR